MEPRPLARVTACTDWAYWPFPCKSENQRSFYGNALLISAGSTKSKNQKEESLGEALLVEFIL